MICILTTAAVENSQVICRPGHDDKLHLASRPLTERFKFLRSLETCLNSHKRRTRISQTYTSIRHVQLDLFDHVSPQVPIYLHQRLGLCLFPVEIRFALGHSVFVCQLNS